MKPIELLFGPVLHGSPAVATAKGVGNRATLSSGSAFTTVSTQLVTSGCMVLLGTQPGSVAVAHNSGGCVVVNSVVDGVSFALARATGVAVPWDEQVSWLIVSTNPK